MKVRYKPDTDTAYIALAKQKVAEGSVYESEEIAPGVVVDYTKDGVAVGVEIYDDARRKLSGSPMSNSEDGRAWLAGYRAGRTDRDAEHGSQRQTREAESS